MTDVATPPVLTSQPDAPPTEVLASRAPLRRQSGP
jgi:hypothetical protein